MFLLFHQHIYSLPKVSLSQITYRVKAYHPKFKVDKRRMWYFLWYLVRETIEDALVWKLKSLSGLERNSLLFLFNTGRGLSFQTSYQGYFYPFLYHDAWDLLVNEFSFTSIHNFIYIEFFLLHMPSGACSRYVSI